MTRAPTSVRGAPPGPSLTLERLFVIATLVIAALVGATFYALLEGSRHSILERSDALRRRAAAQISDEITADLGVASATLDDVERSLQAGVWRADDPGATEGELLAELLDHPTVSDVTLTHADLAGYDAAGHAQLGPGPRWQVSVFRATADADSPAVTRRITSEGADGKTWVAQVRRRPRGGGLASAPFELEAVQADRAPSDPTRHPTFVTTASSKYYGKTIPSDLSFSELDATLAQGERRIVVTEQKAVDDRPGHFAGVVRVGLLTRTIDALPRLRARDAERVVLCDAHGRLVARLDPADRIAAMGDDLRVVPAQMPPEVAAALERPGQSRAFDAGGRRYLVTFQAVPHSQEWMTGVIVPEDFYTRDLRALRDRFLWGLLAVTGVVLLGGWLLLRQVRRSLASVVDATRRMRAFDFAPGAARSGLREIADVLDGVERAKTSVRALGKYVPMDLVRQLFEENREPQLGGQLAQVSLLFTDIEGFTTLAERIAPDALSRALGLYLEAMTRGVRSTGGTVDKFIGDAVMAFWNAPARVDDHAARACRAVLACLAATRQLYASPAWEGLPPLVTRHGLHTARVMVGHFGSPERLSYTALGDGVNLAARLEGLCKQYGVVTLVSEAIVREASASPSGEGLVFRKLDRVAVKGKSESVTVYELLGEASETSDASEGKLRVARAYEAALERYFARDFQGALAGLEASQESGEDPPSRVLAGRCRAMIERPPGEDWNGVYVAKSK